MAGSKVFQVQMGAWAAATEAQLLALTRQACLQMAERVIDTTPVDTGFLRSSWQPAIDGQDGVAVDAGEAPQVATVVAQITPGVHFTLMNNAVYALRIEFGFVGTDKIGRKYNQAGRYMVTDAIKAWPSIVRDIAGQLGIKAK